MALKFVPKKRKVDIEWEDGAIIKFEFPTLKEIFEKFPVLMDKGDNKIILGISILENSLIGWENIEIGETGKPLEYNEENKKQIFDVILQDGVLQEKIVIAMKGPLPNSPAGSLPQ